jgi:hypothetical protein
VAGHVRRSFIETAAQQERGIAAHQPVEAVKEQAAEIGSGW